MGFKSTQRKPVKPKGKKPSSKKQAKKVKKPKTCGKKWGCKCETHDRPCEIPVEFPDADSRPKWMDSLIALGADRHNEDSEHRCFVCEHERRMNSPFKDIEVEGLSDLNQARILAYQQEQQGRFIKAPSNDADDS